jgi:aminoglycoside phosphotransferase (APT) family kinase protein
MEHVDGIVLRTERDVESIAAPDERQAVTDAVVDALVELHAVDPEAVGLGRLGRRNGYAERQLGRWQRQWDASKTRDLLAMAEAHRLLEQRIPEQREVAIVHGDYRLDNVILDATGGVAAVLDWELCTLGDPVADLGMMLVYWIEPGDDVIPLAESATLAAGFPGRAEIAATYARRSGRDIASLPFFVALSRWKLAAILEGVYARAAAGSYGAAGDQFLGFKTTVEQLAEMALAEARALSRV